MRCTCTRRPARSLVFRRKSYIWRRSRRFSFFVCDFDVNFAFLVARFLAFLCPNPFSDKKLRGKFSLQVPLWLGNNDTHPAGGASLLTDPGCKNDQDKTTSRKKRPETPKKSKSRKRHTQKKRRLRGCAAKYCFCVLENKGVFGSP